VGQEGAHVEEVPWYVSLFVSWLPFIVWISVLWWIGRVVARRIEGALRTPDGRSLAEVLAEHARETRRTNELLERAVNDRDAGGR
jgi:hypothetical protein